MNLKDAIIALQKATNEWCSGPVGRSDLMRPYIQRSDRRDPRYIHYGGVLRYQGAIQTKVALSVFDATSDNWELVIPEQTETIMNWNEAYEYLKSNPGVNRIARKSNTRYRYYIEDDDIVANIL